MNALLGTTLFVLIWLGLWLPIALPLAYRLQWRPFQVASPAQKLPLLIPLYGLAPLIIGGANYFGGSILKQSVWVPYDFGDKLLHINTLGIGLLIAIAGLAIVASLQKWLGWVTWEAFAENAASVSPLQRLGIIAGTLVLGLGLGGIEELVFRGWMQAQWAREFSPGIALGIVSVFFAIAHLLWEGRPGLWQQPGLWLLGCVLGVACWVDQGNLSLAWGLHGGWIWGLACLDAVLGAKPTGKGPRWLAGRPQQP
jgi:membrane protease YdiL (CAAX protease family)